MIKDEFAKLARIYRQRYGKFSMETETFNFWWNRLRKLDYEKARNAFENLIGEHDKAFGWKKVFTVIEALYPHTGDYKELESQWAKGVNCKDSDRQSEMMTFMRDLISEVEGAKRKGGSFEWIPSFANKFVEIFGEREAFRICATEIMGTSQDYMMEFRSQVNLVCRNI